MSKKVFISYVSNQEGNWNKDLFIGWVKKDNGSFEFDYHDTSIEISIDSAEADSIKDIIINKIQQSDIFLCLIGEESHKSDWISWEIEQAYAFNKKIVAVKISETFAPPKSILNKGAVWSRSFNYYAIKSALL